MLYTLDDICNILNANWLQKSNPKASISHLLLDSRGVTDPADSLFFALPGQRHDGHQFVSDAYLAGVRNFVVSRAVETAGLPEANVLQVDNSLEALQALAAHHRAQFDLPMIGITGSNGKTVVKEWLYQLLSVRYDIVRSPKSYNSQIGVPLSVWQIREHHTLGIFEAGISRPGEMARLARIIRPGIGIFTNIGPAHREGFDTEMDKLREKMRLFDDTRVLICCAEHDDIAAAAASWQQEKKGRTVFAWSRENRPDAALHIRQEEGEFPGSTTLIYPDPHGNAMTLTLPFSDAASLENVCHCIATLVCMGIPASDFQHRLKRLEPVEMRLELKAGINRCTVINDAYSNDLASLRIALQFAGQQSRNERLTLILSDFLQSGPDQEQLYAQVAAAIREHRIDRLIGIGSDIPLLREYLPAGFDAVFYSDTDTFLQQASWHDFHDELVLLKGARIFAFERIAHRLEQKSHKTVLEVDLSALVHNLNVYHRLLTPGTKMMAMVKAAGYGSGSAELAKLLEYHKVDYLGVAYADEGIELRQAGVRLPILVLNPEPAGFDALLRYRLEPEVYSLELFEEFLRASGNRKEVAIHLKLDTGMHRLGFEPRDIPALIDRLRRHDNVQVRSVFSHLAAADAPEHDAFTHQQAATFSAMYESIGAVLSYRPLRHIANTSGIVRFPQYHFDMVRLGIGLYGIDSSGLQDQLQVVNTLKATISQIKELYPGETVGYSRMGQVGRPSRIATISVGYADGLLRLAGKGQYQVLIHGRRAPTIGNVCMDMTMIDVTGIPDVQEGDEVIVFGEEPPVQELAACLKTIPYEVFTNISERVKRVYWHA